MVAGAAVLPRAAAGVGVGVGVVGVVGVVVGVVGVDAASIDCRPTHWP